MAAEAANLFTVEIVERASRQTYWTSAFRKSMSLGACDNANQPAKLVLAEGQA